MIMDLDIIEIQVVITAIVIASHVDLKTVSGCVKAGRVPVDGRTNHSAMKCVKRICLVSTVKVPVTVRQMTRVILRQDSVSLLTVRMATTELAVRYVSVTLSDMSPCFTLSDVSPCQMCVTLSYLSPLLPRLIKPPTIEVLSCAAVEVSWDRWNADIDDGDPGIHSYTVQYCSVINKETDDCISGDLTDSIPDIPEPPVEDLTTSFSRNVTGLQSNTTYLLTVRTNRVFPELSSYNHLYFHYNAYHYRNTNYHHHSTNYYHHSTYYYHCSTNYYHYSNNYYHYSPTTTTVPTTTTTTIPTTTTVPVPLPLKSVLQVPGSTFAVFRWVFPEVSSRLVLTETHLNYTRLGYKACPGDAAEDLVTQLRLRPSDVNYTLSSLSPFTEYKYSLALEYTLFLDGAQAKIFSDVYEEQFTTLAGASTVPVSGLKVEETGTTWLFLSWTEYPCEYWNSPQLLSYDVEIDGGSILSMSASLTQANVTSLLPNQLYSVRVRPVTSHSPGVFTDALTAKTNNAAPSAPADIQVGSITTDSVTLRLRQPDTTVSAEFYISYTLVRRASCSVAENPSVKSSEVSSSCCY
ncbi:SDK2 [Bugula neritina]|uniref:SDK2 n=1 Tax=Bugula neritina TaxID=10212 RepID=A0A7J7JXB1_BUGNE|nr:SDK2 [Bugula neritina]